MICFVFTRTLKHVYARRKINKCYCMIRVLFVWNFLEFFPNIVKYTFTREFTVFTFFFFFGFYKYISAHAESHLNASLQWFTAVRVSPTSLWQLAQLQCILALCGRVFNPALKYQVFQTIIKTTLNIMMYGCKRTIDELKIKN